MKKLKKLIAVLIICTCVFSINAKANDECLSVYMDTMKGAVSDKFERFYRRCPTDISCIMSAISETEVFLSDSQKIYSDLRVRLPHNMCLQILSEVKKSLIEKMIFELEMWDYLSVMLAARDNKIGVVKFLLNLPLHGKKDNFLNSGGHAILVAASEDHVELVKILLSYPKAGKALSKLRKSYCFDIHTCIKKYCASRGIKFDF